MVGRQLETQAGMGFSWFIVCNRHRAVHLMLTFCICELVG